MSTPLMTPDDTQANRRIWAEWLRRPDWRTIPNHSGSEREGQPTPWHAGYELAYAYWPLSQEVVQEFSDSIEIEDEIMFGCYGLNENGLFDAAELPDAIRRTILMASPGGPFRLALLRPRRRGRPQCDRGIRHRLHLVRIHLVP